MSNTNILAILSNLVLEKGIVIHSYKKIFFKVLFYNIEKGSIYLVCIILNEGYMSNSAILRDFAWRDIESVLHQAVISCQDYLVV